ncbi:MAG: insulinase family protein, partial [Bacteroidota bacterium]
TALSNISGKLAGSFARSLESSQTIARFALNIERYGLPKDYYANYLTRLNAVTKDDVLRVAKKYLKPDNAYITVVGNRDEVSEKLERFSYDGEVKFLDIYGGDYQELSAAPEGMTAMNVIEKYMEAIGGVDKISEVNNLEQEGSMSVQGMSLTMVQKVKDKKKFYMSVSMGPQVFSETVFDGTKGFNSQMGQKMDMTEDEVAEMAMRTDLMSDMRPEEFGLTLTLKGIGEVEGEAAYVVESTDAYGATTTEYYSVESGLKLMSSSTESTPQGDMVITTAVNDYKEVDGIKFPSKITQTVGPQNIVIEFSSIKVNPKLSNSDFKVN